MQLQMDFDYKEECEGSSDNILVDESGSSRPRGISTWLQASLLVLVPPPSTPRKLGEVW